MKVSFVLPSGGRAGGVRSTVILADGLLKRGYDVRLLCRSMPISSKAWLKQYAKNILHKICCYHNDWVKDFQGAVESYIDINQIEFSKGEIVVAVGSMVVGDVYALNAEVVKLRHCRGFSSYNPELMKAAWGGDMPTISVSSTLVPQLEKYSGQKVLGVVPNGKELDLYYNEGRVRDGVGTIYYEHPNKCPADTLTVLKKVKEKWPQLRIYVFGTPRRPSCIPKGSYFRYPSIDKIREIYNRTKVWVLTSRDEGLPGPVLEAMACGSVVVSTDNLGSLEVVKNNENGMLVPLGDIDSFIDKIEYLLENEEERFRLANNAYSTVKGFTWESALDAIEIMLKRLTQ